MSVAPISSRPALETVRAILAAADLPTSDLSDEHCEHFFYAGDRSEPAGIVGVEMLGDGALLRSLVVRSDARSSGLGSALVSHVESYARSRGIREIYLLTTTAESFFEVRGYQKAMRDHAPAAIKSTREFSGICPASSAFMNKQL